MSTDSNILKDVWDILSYKAFLPDPAEPTLPLRNRAFGTVAGLYIGPAQMVGCLIHHTRVGFSFSNITKRPIDFALKELHPEDIRTLFREKVDDVVVIAGGLTDIALKSNIRRQPEVSEIVMLSSQPQKLLGSNFVANHRYSLLHNPVHNQSFLAGTDQLQLNVIVEVVKRAQFRVIRLQSAMVCALDKVLDEDDVKQGRIFPLILDNGNAFFTRVGQQGNWEGWRYRAKVISSPEESALKVFLNSLSLTAQDNLLIVDMGSNYDYPIEKDLEGINFRRFEATSVGREYLPFYLSTLN
jgi:hypothetical protein